MLVYLLLDQFCKEQKAQQSPHAITASAARYVNLTFQEKGAVLNTAFCSVGR